MFAPIRAQLDPLGAVFDSMFETACTKLDNDDRQGSEEICRELLMHANLGKFHRAGCHYILGLGVDCYLEHAQKAVHIYENMYKPDQVVKATERAANETLLGCARRSLKKAQEDYDKIEKDYAKQMERFIARHGRRPTNLELVQADFEHNREWVEEFLEKITPAYGVERWTQPTDAELMEDHDGDDDDNEPIPFIAMPTPPPSSPLASSPSLSIYTPDGEDLGRESSVSQHGHGLQTPQAAQEDD